MRQYICMRCNANMTCENVKNGTGTCTHCGCRNQYLNERQPHYDQDAIDDFSACGYSEDQICGFTPGDQW